VYVGGVNNLGGRVRSIKKMYYLVIANKQSGLEENVGISKYMVITGDENTGRRYSIKFDNSYCEMLGELEFL
jgi:hypothetical protein